MTPAELRSCFGLSRERISSSHNDQVDDFLESFWHLIDTDDDNRLNMKEWKHTLFAFTYTNALWVMHKSQLTDYYLKCCDAWLWHQQEQLFGREWTSKFACIYTGTDDTHLIDAEFICLELIAPRKFGNWCRFWRSVGKVRNPFTRHGG